MKRITKKCLVMNLVFMMSIETSISAMADTAAWSGLSQEYGVTADGYVFANEITEEMIKDIEAVNSEMAESKENVHYAVVDGGVSARLQDDLQDWVYKMCSEYGIQGYERLVLAKLYCESGYNPNTVHRNKNGTMDYGIAQINSSNHARLRQLLGITDFMDPYQSIRAGVYMLSECLRANGFNEEMALVAYNSGRNGISSSKYSRKVMGIKNSEVVS